MKMLYILAVAFVLFLLWRRSKSLNLSPQAIFLIALAVIAVVLFISGKGSALFAALATLAATLERFAHFGLRNASLWQNLYQRYLNPERQVPPHDGNAKNQSAKPHTPMSATEALATLGLNPGASDDEVRRAHRRLIASLHPDKGGSAELAAQVNRARDILIG